MDHCSCASNSKAKHLGHVQDVPASGVDHVTPGYFSPRAWGMICSTHVLVGMLTGLLVLSVRNSVLVIPQILAMAEKSSDFVNTLDVPGAV